MTVQNADIPMQAFEELFALSEKLRDAAGVSDVLVVRQALDALNSAAEKVQRSFSGSWLGYQSRIYYAEFAPPPPGAHFSQEWGLISRMPSLGSRGDWREYDPEDVKDHIRRLAKNPNLKPAEDAAAKANATFSETKSEILSILENELGDTSDGFLEKLRADLNKLESTSAFEVVRVWCPTGQIVTRDMVAMGQGRLAPPHVEILAEIVAIQHAFDACKSVADIATKAASHLERKNRRKVTVGRVGTNVFIGHGQSAAWRELKDFVQDRLALPWDEFNRVPVAGVTNIARLSEMLDAAAIAFLVMTAEDEMADGEIQARLNVVHEAGLFQGRLGFARAILLLEDGCKEFSNIQGLGQIRFPKANIAASFEEVRRVIEREGLIGEADVAHKALPRKQAKG